VPIVPLYGHAVVRERLLGALARNTLPASLLLTGPRGVGKQRLALWLGQVLLCAAPERPCGRCEQCRFSAELTHPDLHWYFPRPRPKDSAPSVDDVFADYAQAIADRVKDGGLYAAPSGSEGIFMATVGAVLHQAARSPALARQKVFVIGDAERMVPQESAPEAANAFLKLLEEPPADTTIVLTSSEPGALLPTIRSRVVSVRVAPLSDGEIHAFLATERVAASLGAEVSEAERVRIAAGAPGVLLDAASRGTAAAAARRLLDGATGGSRARLLRAVFAQGSAGARGDFRDLLDALTTLLHERMRGAVERGDARGASAAARAMDAVEEAKLRAAGNVTPHLIAAALSRALTEVPR
jgi:DNA polymerase-3 subunit delta'